MSTPVRDGALVAGRYRLGPLLGQGGMGRVWAAHDEVLERDVAVKEVVVPPGVPDGEREALVARTLREARAAARVRHPRVVTVYDVAADDDRPWIVLQLLAPRTLADVLAQEGPLDPARAARIGLQVLDGLGAVHEAGVLHRDVKPGNVLFDPDGDAVLADFGVASLDDDAAVTATGLVLGSPAYLAPERARGAAPTAAADLWSLGATLYAAVEGRSPFHRDGPLPTLGALLTEDVPEPPAAGPLAPAVAALLTKDPADRPDAATARALLEAALTAATAAGDDNLTVATPAARLEEDTAPMQLPTPVTTLMAAVRDVAPVPAAPLRPVPDLARTAAPAPAPAAPRVRRHRRALLAVAAVAVLSVPVTALAEHPFRGSPQLPASAGDSALFVTTPHHSSTARSGSTARPARAKPSTSKGTSAVTTSTPVGAGTGTRSTGSVPEQANGPRPVAGDSSDDASKGGGDGHAGQKNGRADGDGKNKDAGKGKDKDPKGDDGGSGVDAGSSGGDDGSAQE